LALRFQIKSTSVRARANTRRECQVRNAAGFARFPRDASGIESLMMAAETSLVASKAEETERYSGPAGRI